jgi:hypothetical protein
MIELQKKDRMFISLLIAAKRLGLVRLKIAFSDWECVCTFVWEFDDNAIFYANVKKYSVPSGWDNIPSNLHEFSLVVLAHF